MIIVTWFWVHNHKTSKTRHNKLFSQISCHLDRALTQPEKRAIILSDKESENPPSIYPLQSIQIDTDKMVADQTNSILALLKNEKPL